MTIARAAVLLGLIAALGAVAAARANPAGAAEVPSAIRGGAGTGSPTKIVGGGYGQPQVEEDKAPPGGILIGFEAGRGAVFGIDAVCAVRPIYVNAKGKQITGARHGLAPAQIVLVKAKPGYAVGAITGRAGLLLDGFSVTFMKITKHGLDPQDSYESDWIGGKGGNEALRLGGDGRLVIGIACAVSQKNLSGLGLIMAATAAAPNTPMADQPPAEEPADVLPVQPSPSVAPSPPVAPAVARAGRTLDEGDLQQLLKRLDEGPAKAQETLRELAGARPQTPNEPAARQIERFLADIRSEDQSLRQLAAAALKNWATPQSIPVLHTALGDEAGEVRAAAIEALVALANAEAADALVRGYDRQPPTVTEGLKKMGAVAEEATQRLARHPSDRARSAACGILEAVGTEKSLPLLDKMGEEEAGESVRQAAKHAAEVVRSRGGIPAKDTPSKP
jgi:hypothetical protein